jgi:hypothetical protein
MTFIPEFRLAAAIILNAAVFAGAWRFVRRRVATDPYDRAADVLLLVFIVQYVSVALPGILGILNFGSIALTALFISTALYFTSSGTVEGIKIDNPTDRWTLRGASAFAVAYLATIVAHMAIGYSPVTSNDALIYHFPTAVQWIQTGRLGIYEPWFFNPTNAYSPVAGSTFIAWWIAPLGNSALARYVQVPAALLIFFAIVRIVRAAGVRSAVAAILAAALVASQPIVRQSIIEKDDLYLAAFFACAVGAMARDRLTDTLGTWRLGAAVGMMLATKYTALMIAPALLLLIDAPFRAGWRGRQWAIASAVTLVLAGPWFVRNLVLTGNPLYPMGSLFSSSRSGELPGRLWDVLTHRDQSLPPAAMIALLIGALAGWVLHFRHIIVQPITRIILIGPIVLIVIFALNSPFPEARYAYGAFLLLLAAAALAIQAIPWNALQLVCGGTLFATAAASGMPPVFLEQLLPLGLIVTALIAAALLAYDYLGARRKQITAIAGLAAVLVIAGGIYVNWPGYLNRCREAVVHHYPIHYAWEAPIWLWINEQIPPTERLAYSNTFLVLPLTGFDHSRPIVYVPTRKGVRHFTDLPRWKDKWPGEALLPQMQRELFTDPDEKWWLEGLQKSGARYIVIFKQAQGPRPPELDMIARHPQRFELLLDHASGAVYRIR